MATRDDEPRATAPARDLDPRTGVPAGLLRDQLANERTLLAWLRTAIALMGFGLVVARFGLFLRTLIVLQDSATAARLAAEGEHSTLIGAALLITGSIVAAIGWTRTRAYARTLELPRAFPSMRVLTSTTALVALLGLGLAAYLVLLA